MRKLFVACVAVAVAGGLVLDTRVRAAAGTAAATTTVYTANSEDQSVSLLDGEAIDSVVNDIDIPDAAGALDVSPDGRRVYVVGGDDGDRVSMLDAATNAFLMSVEVSEADDLTDVVVSPDNARVYVTGHATGSVYVLDAQTLETLDTFPLDLEGGGTASPEEIDVSADGAEVFVLSPANDLLQKVSTADGSVAASVDLEDNAAEVRVSADGQTVVVAGDNRVQFFLADALQPIPDSDDDRGDAVDVAAAGARFYVLNNDYREPGKRPPLRDAPANFQPSIDVYDAATGEHLESFGLGGGSDEDVLGIAVASDASCAYFSRSEGEGSGGRVTRVDLADGTLGTSGGTGGTPERVALREALAPPVPIAAYILPRKLDLKLKGAGRDTLAVAGTYDDGGADVDYAEEVTLVVGGYARSFTPVPAGKGFRFKDASFTVRLTPNVKGSSRGLFKLKLKKATLNEAIQPSEAVTLRLRGSGLDDASGRVLLTNGRYRIQRIRGALVAPGVFPVKAVAKLAGGGVGTLKLVGGLATNGQTPETLGAVRVGFGPSFSRVIPGEAFTRRGDVFTYVVPGKAKLTIRIDFRREVFFVTARKAALGALDTPTVDVVFDAGGGQGAFSNTVRLGRKGEKRLY